VAQRHRRRESGEGLEPAPLLGAVGRDGPAGEGPWNTAFVASFLSSEKGGGRAGPEFRSGEAQDLLQANERRCLRGKGEMIVGTALIADCENGESGLAMPACALPSISRPSRSPELRRVEPQGNGRFTEADRGSGTAYLGAKLPI
jgi:hypothetical protein